MTKNKTEVIESPQEEATHMIESPSPEALIAHAITKGLSVESLEKLLAMRKELRAERAKEKYDEAMAAFQCACPIIHKRKAGGETKFGKIAYYYAPIEDIIDQTKALIGANGFSYSIQSKTRVDGVDATCVVKHINGHSESVSITVPMTGGTPVMSAPQIVMATLTFAKRYAFCNAFGIITGDTDTGAQESPRATRTAKSNTTTRTPEETQQARYNALVAGISRIFFIPEVEDYIKKMEKSDKYTAEQKVEFLKVAMARIADIQKDLIPESEIHPQK